MFRISLIATTALVICVSVVFATEGTRAGASRPNFLPERARASGPVGVAAKRGGAIHNKSHWVPGAIFNNFSKDRNAEFISWYGFAALNESFSDFASPGSFYRFIEETQNAVPFSGGGKLKTMTFAAVAGPSNLFEGEILSSVGGLPGNVIATTSAMTFSSAAPCCTSVRTAKFIPGPAKLPKGNYFAAFVCANFPCLGAWNFEDVDITGATVDYLRVIERESYNFGTGTHTFQFSSPWHSSNFYPEAGAVIVK